MRGTHDVDNRAGVDRLGHEAFEVAVVVLDPPFEPDADEPASDVPEPDSDWLVVEVPDSLVLDPPSDAVSLELPVPVELPVSLELLAARESLR